MSRVLSHGPFEIDPERGTLTRDGATNALGQRATALLAALMARQGQAVSKADLMEAGWPGLAVEEGNLTVQIAGLRKLMGQDLEGRDWIVTVPRVGYRLVVPEPPAASLPDGPRPSLAVMPFINLGGDAAQDYFADGVVEDIITALSRFTSFSVVARSSSFAYKGRAVDVRRLSEELGVRYVLEGSVRRSGDRMRITAQLVECQNGLHIWAEHYDGGLSQIFDVQDRITESVAARVEPRVLQAEIDRARRKPPSSMVAYDLYLQALPDVFVTHPDANARAIALLDRAIQLDPGFAQAMAIQAQALLLKIVMAFDGSSTADAQRAVALARKATDLAPDDASVIAYAGFVRLQIGGEYDFGLAQLRRAVAANPNNVDVLNVSGVGELMGGDLTLAADFLQRALLLCPNSLGTHWQLTGMAHIRMAERRYEDALDWATRSHAVNPGYDANHWMLIAANAHLGRIETARLHLGALLDLSPGMTLNRLRQAQRPRDPWRIEVLIAGLRLAGLPDG